MMIFGKWYSFVLVIPRTIGRYILKVLNLKKSLCWTSIFLWLKDFKQKHCNLYRFLRFQGIFVCLDCTILPWKEKKVSMKMFLFFQKKGNWEIWLLRKAYIFEGKKQMKSVGSMVGWAGFLLHTQPRHLLHFGCVFRWQRKLDRPTLIADTLKVEKQSFTK